MTARAGYEDVPVMHLMRVAGDAYREVVRRALGAAGCDDIPRKGALVLIGLDHGSTEPRFSPQADVVASLGLSKQAASQLIDTLVLREYVERRNDPEDRRRMIVRLTARGRAAAAAVDSAEAALAQRITPEELRGLRAGLAALGAITGQPDDEAPR